MLCIDNALIFNPARVSLCLDPKKYRRFLRQRGIDEASAKPFVNAGADATVHTFENAGKQTEIVVCLTNVNRMDGIALAALLVHEAVHVWQRVRDMIGEERPSTEFEAYSVQAIAQELMRAYVALAPKAP